MFRNNFKAKFSLYMLLALSPGLVLLPYAIVTHQQEHLQTEISRHVAQIAEVIVKSTRYAMLVNQRDITEKIIEDVGRQAGIERVRILTKDGTIIHSKRKSEIGFTVQQNDEPCVRCHLSGKPLQRVADDQRWRIYTDADGQRLLATMEPIRNEPTCSNASCHEHPASQSVLGVLDIAYSLDDVDRTLKRHAIVILALSAGVSLLVAAGVGVLLQRLIYLPLKDLNTGARRISSGELDHQIPVRSGDEFGHVARSFNDMSSALKRSMHELQELVGTLEQKVAERTKELRAAEAEVAQGEKLASIGLLASGIAHELNNPLTGVLTFTSLLRKKMPAGSTDAEDLDLVIQETKRCASIIRRLLDFAREKVPTNGFVAMNPLIEEVVRFVDRPASLHNVEIVTHLEPNLPQVWGDADLIKQVVLNIMVNATQAIEREGKIVIETRRVDGKDPGAPPMVEFSIRDNGCGIPQANLQRIFDPFFTTKEVGRGTGLGLSVSYGIVKAHGGTIKVDSVVGEGSTFRVQLPTVPPVDQTEATTDEAKAMRPHGHPQSELPRGDTAGSAGGPR
jgi:two-component system NtrC family sensor kinase